MSAIRIGRAAAALAAVAVTACGAGTASAAVGTAQPARGVMILLDVNDSFPASDASAEQAAAVAYLDALPADVQAGLITFSGSWTLVTAPTTDRSTVTSAISSAQRSDQVSTGLAGALTAAQSALAALGTGADDRVLVLSDGEELTGTAPAFSVPTDVVAWAFEFDDNSALLQSLATATGGRAAAPTAAATLAAAFPPLAPVPAPTVRPTAVTPSHAPVVASPALPTSAPWHFSATLLIAAGALAAAIVAIVLLVSGVSSSGRRGRRLAGLVAQYGPAHRAKTPTSADDAAHSKVVGAALGLADRALQARGTDRTLADRMDIAGLTMKPAEFVVLGGCATIVLMAGFTILTGGSFLIGVPAGLVAGYLAMYLLLSVRIGRRRGAFGQQLPDVLQLIASSLQSGFSLAQAIDAVVREGNQPAAAEFARALGEARIGGDLADGLDGVASRMDSKDMRWTVMAIRIQRSVGGNLAEVLRNTIATMRERAFLRGHVKALSAEGRLSAYILVALPILLGGWLFYTSGEYMRLLYTTPYGLMMLCGATVLLVIGALWMRVLIKVEV